MRKRILCSLATILIVSATAAFGAVKEDSFSVTPLIGGYIYDNDQSLDPTLVLGLRAGYNFTKHFGVEALYDYATPTDASSGPLKNIALHRFGAQGLYHFFPDNVFVPYFAAGYSGLIIDGNGFSDKTHGAFDYGVGAKYFLTDDIAIRGDVRHIVYKDSYALHHVEFTLGAYMQFGAPAPAAKAIAPEPTPPPEPVKAAEPAPAPPAPIAAPAPPPPPAPSATLSVVPARITKGDSATLTWTSQNASKCDIQPSIGSVQPQGSVIVMPSDNTSYSVTCTGEGGTATNAAELAVAVPPPVIAAKLCSPTVINIQFDLNKADIKPQFHDELKKLGDFLKEFPQAKGNIEGHTDSTGSKASNIKLSQRRAENVRDYIVKTFGIAPERISAKGYGPAKPIADNKTTAGKQQNRRIEANFTCNGK